MLFMFYFCSKKFWQTNVYLEKRFFVLKFLASKCVSRRIFLESKIYLFINQNHIHVYLTCLWILILLITDSKILLNMSYFSSVAHSCPTLCDPMNHSTPGLPVHHQLPEFTQTHIH